MTKRLLALTLVSSVVACSDPRPYVGSGGTVGTGSGGTTSSTGGTTSTASGGKTGSTGGTVGTGSGGTTASTGGGTGTGSGGMKASTGGATVTGSGGGMTTGSGGKAGSGAGAGMPMGGQVGTGSGGTAPGSGGTAPSGGNSVLERNNHPSRDGNFLQPTLTKAAAAKMAPDAAFMATFTGGMLASPLYFESGPGGKGVFIVATTGNDVLALDETTGATVWKTSIGAPATGGLGCSGIAPTDFSSLGIISTPVIDAATGTIYVVGGTGSSSGVTAVIMSALDIQTGMVKSGWPVNLTMKVGFDAKLHLQRSALSLVGGVVYAAFGGYVGDCGAYTGRVVAVKASDPTQVAGWASGGQGEGIWPAGGMSSDGTSIYVTTGNKTSGGTARANSESIIRLTGMATFGASDMKNYYYPTRFASMDTSDADLSASNPIFFKLAGSTPSNLVAAFSKDGHMYLTNADNLGGAGAELNDTMLSTGTMSLYSTPTIYTTSGGLRMAVTAKGGSICPSGGGSGAVMAVSIAPGSPPKPTTLWCAAVTGSANQHAISTTTDGTTDAIVWVMNGTKLNAFDGETGASITTGGSGTCSNVHHWTSPIAVKGRIVVGGDGHLCSWSSQ